MLKLGALDGSTFAPGAEGGVRVVHFFATWCEPCRAELPELARFAARAPQVRVVLVDVGEVAVRVRRYLDSLAMADAFPADRVLLDLDRGVARAFGVSLLPSTLVVADGRVVLSREGEVDWADPETLRRIAAFIRGEGATGAASPLPHDPSRDPPQGPARDLPRLQARNDPATQPDDQPGGTVR